MSEVVERVDLDALLVAAHGIVDALQALDLSGHSDDQVLTALRSFEMLRRRLEPVDHALILDVERRGVPGTLIARGPAPWLRQTLMIDIHEANARVRAAHAAAHAARCSARRCRRATPRWQRRRQRVHWPPSRRG